MRVLVADDDKSLLELISTVLECEGHVVQTASNGQEALDHVVEDRPDLILLDLRMPLMDGWTCCRSLKESPDTASIPVIIMSADKVGAAVHADLGIEHFLSKPFDLHNMLSCVSKCVGKKSGKKELGEINP